MYLKRSVHGRFRAPVPAAVLLLACCLLVGGVQAADVPLFVVGDILEIGTGNTTYQVIVANVDTTSLPTPYYTMYDVEQNAGRWEIPRYWHQDQKVDEQNLVESLDARRIGHVDPVRVVVTDTTITGGDQLYAGLSLWEVLHGAIYWPEDSGNSPLWLEGDIAGEHSLIAGVMTENQSEPLYSIYSVFRHGDRWFIEKYWHGNDNFPESWLRENNFTRTHHVDPHFIVINDTTITGGDMLSYGTTLAEGTGYWVENWEERPSAVSETRYIVGDVLGNETSPARFVVANVTEVGLEYPRYTLYPAVADGDGWRITRYPSDPLVLDAIEVWERAMHRQAHTDPHFAVVDDPSAANGVTYNGLSLGEILEGTPGYPPASPGPIGGDIGYFLVSTAPAGAEVALVDISGTRYPKGNTSAGPLNISVYLTATPIRQVVVTLPGYRDAVHNVTQYPPKGGTLPVSLALEPVGGPQPYRPLSIPGRIQAEDYDIGGFSDTTPGNSGGAYRQDDVDIEVQGGITNVGWIRNGEFLAYTANVTAAGDYTLTARVASPNSGRTFAVSVDGVQQATIAIPKTGSFATFRTVAVPIALEAGTHTVKLAFQGDGQNLDWIEFAPVSTPPPQPNGTPYKPLAIPGTIQAEDYNLGGEGVAYHDTTPGNSGGAYRADGVDIEVQGGITNVGWIRNGEFLTYTASVAEAGQYTMSARVASPNSGRTFAVSVDGAAAGTIAVPSTGSFATFRTLEVPVTLEAGTHTVKLAFQGDGQNLDWIAFRAPGEVSTPTPTPTPGAGGASFTAAPVTAPKGSAVKFAVTPASGKTIRSAWWSFDAPAHLNTWNSRATNPTFFYPRTGTFSPLVKLVYTDGSTETVQRANYVRAT